MVGGGVSGLIAARRLAQAGVAVTVWEAEGRVGGQVRSVEVAPGVFVDVGAEALHLGVPRTAVLVTELDLAETMVESVSGSSRLVTPRGLRPLPAGVGPAGPTRLGPVVRSRTLTLAALVRAGLEPVVARRMPVLADGADMSVGDFVSRRFGSAVTRTFVDPLLGNLHAGDVSRLSLRGCSPALVPAAASGRSLVFRRRSSRQGGQPGFVTWPEGLSTFTSRLLADQPGVTVRTSTPVTSLALDAEGSYHVGSPTGRAMVDAVVLAAPARVGARLLASVAPTTAATLAAVEVSDVVTVLVGVPAPAARKGLPGTGLLVPSDTGRLLKAATYLSHKWPHLAPDDTCWLRLSAGRAGERRTQDMSDDDLVDALMGDLRDLTGFSGTPTSAVVGRWPQALPQFTVGHPDRIAQARRALPQGVVLAGASYDGLGLGACIGSGESAARALLRLGEER